MAPSLPARLQDRLRQLYAIDDSPSIDDFIEPVDDTEREALLIDDREGDLRVSLRLPRAIIDAQRQPTFDELCQVVEGVSHFVYVAERARTELPATQLELELQAEVDKYLLFALRLEARAPGSDAGFAVRSAALRARLFEKVTYLDPPGTETGDRYRLANDLAARFAVRIERRIAMAGRFDEMRFSLRRFYRAGQAEKIALARAA